MKKIFNILSELDNWLTSYLVWKEVESFTTLRQYVLLRIYFKRGLTDRFNKLIKQSIKAMESISNGFWTPLFRMIFYHVRYFNSNTTDLFKSSNLNFAMKYLDQFYLQAKLRYVGEQVNRSNVLKDSKDFPIPTSSR